MKIFELENGIKKARNDKAARGNKIQVEIVKRVLHQDVS